MFTKHHLKDQVEAKRWLSGWSTCHQAEDLSLSPSIHVTTRCSSMCLKPQSLGDGHRRIIKIETGSPRDSQKLVMNKADSDGRQWDRVLPWPACAMSTHRTYTKMKWAILIIFMSKVSRTWLCWCFLSRLLTPFFFQYFLNRFTRALTLHSGIPAFSWTVNIAFACVPFANAKTLWGTRTW